MEVAQNVRVLTSDVEQPLHSHRRRFTSASYVAHVLLAYINSTLEALFT
jgi:hypothetical protein